MNAMKEEFTPKDEVSDMKMEINFKALSDLTIEQLERATWELINTRKTASFPKVAEIRDAAIGSVEDKAILAYDAFTKGKGATGIYRSVCFEDKMIHAVVEAMGGWTDVCQITEDEWKFRRREFLDLYKAMSRHCNRDIPDRLIGLAEHGCNQNPEWENHKRPAALITMTGTVVEDRKQIAEERVKVLEGK